MSDMGIECEVLLAFATRVLMSHGRPHSPREFPKKAAARAVDRDGRDAPRGGDSRLREGGLFQGDHEPDRDGLVELVGTRLSAATPETFNAVVRELIGELLRAEGINPALHRVLIEQVLRTSARREMLGFEERLEAALAAGMRAAKIELADPELSAFMLVRVVLSVVQSAVVDRPKYKSDALADELTKLVVGYVSRAGAG
jgi:hypothetical protein